VLVSARIGCTGILEGWLIGGGKVAAWFTGVAVVSGTLALAVDHKAAVARLDGRSFRWLFPHRRRVVYCAFAHRSTCPIGGHGVTGGKPAGQGRRGYPTTRGLPPQAQVDTVLTPGLGSVRESELHQPGHFANAPQPTSVIPSKLVGIMPDQVDNLWRRQRRR
jgi:hypothetical protein